MAISSLEPSSDYSEPAEAEPDIIGPDRHGSRCPPSWTPLCSHGLVGGFPLHPPSNARDGRSPPLSAGVHPLPPHPSFVPKVTLNDGSFCTTMLLEE
jgi:hypothetical protein